VNCGPVSIDSCPKINNEAYEVNRQMILVMRLLGIDINGIKKFCAFMDFLRLVFQKSYDEIINHISVAAETVSSFSMKKAVSEEKEISSLKGESRGITVSSDGSWRKREFSSLYGIISLIAWYTGKVIDVAVKSKYCKSCEYWKKQENTAEYN